MSMDVSIDMGSVIPYAIDRVLSLFGKDFITVEARERLRRRITSGVADASSVQCVGMDRPIPFSDIYQPTRLRRRQFADGEGHYALADVVEANGNTIVWGGPGAGKSMFVRSALLALIHQPDTIPILFTLRSPGGVDDLAAFVKDLSDSRPIPNKKTRVV